MRVNPLITIPQDGRPILKLTGIAAAILSMSVPAPALSGAAFNAVQDYDIPAQPLDNALTELADSADLKLLYQSELVGNRQSHALSGRYSPQQALQIVLKDTGLGYRFTRENAVTVVKEADIVLTDAAASGHDREKNEDVTLAPLKVTASVLDEAKEAEQDIDAKSPYNPHYNRIQAFSASKTDTPIMQTPMNIQVVPTSILNDQQDITLTDAITKNVSGIQANYGSGGIYETFKLRGFTTNDIYRNGLLRGFNQYDPSNIEQLEVIKGPASMLYGRAQPGGLINYVTKKGLDTPYYSVQQQFGSYDQYRTTADATGAIDQDGKLSYRLNFSYQDIGSFKKFVNDERYFVAPTLSWRPNERFEANVEVEYKHEKRVGDFGIPSIGNRPAPVPLNSSFLDQAKGPVSDTTLVAYDWAFKFNDDWKLSNRFLWENWDMEYGDYGNYGQLQADNCTLNRFLVDGPANSETYSTNLDLIGHFSLLDSQHAVLLGGDYYRNAFNGLNEHYSPMASIDIFNPVYNVVTQATINATPLDWNFMRKEERFGVYFQDQITLFDKLHIMGGGRYDWVTYGTGADSKSADLAKANYSDQQDQKFSPRVGMLYQPMQWLSLYGSYTESLGTANQGMSFTGQNFKPEVGEQYEAGFKTELFDKRFSSTVSFYHLEKTNTTTNDPIHPNFKITAGKVRSRGIEVDMKGQVTEKLNLVTTYAFTDIRYVNANANLLGQRPINVPEHQASLWGTYQFTERFKAGLGGVAVSKRLGDNNNPVDLPGYVTMDAMAAYTLPVGKTRLTTQVNINNLLDKDYYLGSGYGRNSITVGNPLSVMGSIRLQF